MASLPVRHSAVLCDLPPIRSEPGRRGGGGAHPSGSFARGWQPHLHLRLPQQPVLRVHPAGGIESGRDLDAGGLDLQPRHRVHHAAAQLYIRGLQVQAVRAATCPGCHRWHDLGTQWRTSGGRHDLSGLSSSQCSPDHCSTQGSTFRSRCGLHATPACRPRWQVQSLYFLSLPSRHGVEQCPAGADISVPARKPPVCGAH